MHGNVAQSSHSCPGRNEGIVQAPGVADQWIATEKEGETTRLCKELQANRAQQEETEYCAFYKSGPKRGLQCTSLCLPDADGVFP